jgi:hypothetical protein
MDPSAQGTTRSLIMSTARSRTGMFRPRSSMASQSIRREDAISLTSDGPHRSPEQLVVFGDAAEGAERKRRQAVMIPFRMRRLE